MRGLIRITNYYNRLEAQKDWANLVQTALNVPVAEIVKIAPKPEYGWRRIDKCIAKLRVLIEKYEAQS